MASVILVLAFDPLVTEKLLHTIGRSSIASSLFFCFLGDRTCVSETLIAEFAPSAIGASTDLGDTVRFLPASNETACCNGVSLVFTALLLATESAMCDCCFYPAKKKACRMFDVQMLRTSELERWLKNWKPLALFRNYSNVKARFSVELLDGLIFRKQK